MAEITVAKARSGFPDQMIPDTHIHVVGQLPPIDSNEKDWLAKWVTLCDEQARQLNEALYTALPGGVYDRLCGHMLARKASHFGVAHDAQNKLVDDQSSTRGRSAASHSGDLGQGNRDADTETRGAGGN
jgi:hypothetical protein